MPKRTALLLFLTIQSLWATASAFAGPHQTQRRKADLRPHRPRRAAGDDVEDDGGSSYESSASLTKGIVSSLTSLANSVFGGQPPAPDPSEGGPTTSSSSFKAPASPGELRSRIRDEYAENNYLWTGALDISSFAPDCTFTDPTISFQGVDKYVSNVGSLVPVVEYLLGEEQMSRSDLLNITLTDEYVETRWNMVGEFNRLPWKPRIDVIGRTKFWFREVQRAEGEGGGEEGDPAYQVYFYDEMWEIPAGLALLQLVTKAGTIANTGYDKK